MGQAVIDAAAARPRPTVIIVITDGGTTWAPHTAPRSHRRRRLRAHPPRLRKLGPPWITAVHAFDPGPCPPKTPRARTRARGRLAERSPARSGLPDQRGGSQQL